MTEIARIAKNEKLKRRGRFFTFLFITAIFAILLAFGLYQLLLGQAFADRGSSRNKVPRVFSKTDRISLIKTLSAQFKCDQRDFKVSDITLLRRVGAFPYLLKNDLSVCNNAEEFVGYDQFIQAMLWGEQKPGRPAKSVEHQPEDHHRPGILWLQSLFRTGKRYDRVVEFYWWLFPLPMAQSNRGFSYAIFQGDLEGLIKAAKSRNLDFFGLYLEGVKTFMEFQGWCSDEIKPSPKHSPFMYDDRDHVVTKAWLSLKCFSEYQIESSDYQQKLVSYRHSLESFMERKKIRYPNDFECSEQNAS